MIRCIPRTHTYTINQYNVAALRMNIFVHDLFMHRVRVCAHFLAHAVNDTSISIGSSKYAIVVDFHIVRDNCWPLAQ